MFHGQWIRVGMNRSGQAMRKWESVRNEEMQEWREEKEEGVKERRRGAKCQKRGKESPPNIVYSAVPPFTASGIIHTRTVNLASMVTRHDHTFIAVAGSHLVQSRISIGWSRAMVHIHRLHEMTLHSILRSFIISSDNDSSQLSSCRPEHRLTEPRSLIRPVIQKQVLGP